MRYLKLFENYKDKIDTISDIFIEYADAFHLVEVDDLSQVMDDHDNFYTIKSEKKDDVENTKLYRVVVSFDSDTKIEILKEFKDNMEKFCSRLLKFGFKEADLQWGGGIIYAIFISTESYTETFASGNRAITRKKFETLFHDKILKNYDIDDVKELFEIKVAELFNLKLININYFSPYSPTGYGIFCYREFWPTDVNGCDYVQIFIKISKDIDSQEFVNYIQNSFSKSINSFGYNVDKLSNIFGNSYSLDIAPKDNK